MGIFETGCGFTALFFFISKPSCWFKIPVSSNSRYNQDRTTDIINHVSVHVNNVEKLQKIPFKWSHTTEPGNNTEKHTCASFQNWNKTKTQQGSATIYVLGCGLALFSPGLSRGLSLSSDYISWDAVPWNEEVVHYMRQKSIWNVREGHVKCKQFPMFMKQLQ